MFDSGLKEYICQLENINSQYFLDPQGKSYEGLINMIKYSLINVLENQGESPIYGIGENKTSKSALISNATIPLETTLDFQEILDQIPQYLSGSVKANHPHLAKNIIPIPNFIYLVTNLVSSFFMANAVTGEDSGNLLNAELETVSGLSKLIGFDHEKSGGMFTFGGTATNFYGIKVGLCKVDPDHVNNGITQNIDVIGSFPGHYSHLSGIQWLGIGAKNYVKTRSNLDQSVNTLELELNCRKSIENGKKIACIILSGGTTSGMGIDDIKSVYILREKLIKEYNLDYRPHLHLDSVLGWAYLNFINYDIDKNPSNFSEEVCKKLRLIVEKVKQFKYVDSLGIDFHKSGYIPYTSSVVIFKDKEDLGFLMKNKEDITPLFHDENVYNPGLFTFETSRSSSNILGTWLSLKALGQKGFQTLLGNTLENSQAIQDELKEYKSDGLITVSKTLGADVYIRAYDKSILDLDSEFNNELNNDDVLKRNDIYLNKFSSWLLKTKNVIKYGISLGKTSAAFYTNTGQPYQAIRIYSLNPFLNRTSAKLLVELLVKAKRDFDQTL